MISLIPAKQRLWRFFLKKGGALFGLLALLDGPAQFVPELLAVAAAFEGSHTVYVGQTETGCKVILSHQRGQTGRRDYDPRHEPTNAAHRHGIGSRLLCTLAGSTQQLSDHVASFSNGSSSESSRVQTKAKRLATESGSITLPAFSTPSFEFLFSLPRAGQTEPPLVTSAVRPVVLLI